MGAELLAKQGRDWNTFAKADPGAAHFFGETGHAIAPQFWAYWSSHGLELDGRRGISFPESLALFGMPLSEAQTETNPTDGQPYLTQWFERARFELHPAADGIAGTVLLARGGGGRGGAPGGRPGTSSAACRAAEYPGQLHPGIRRAADLPGPADPDQGRELLPAVAAVGRDVEGLGWPAGRA